MRAKRTRPAVYLAGPISGCNSDQISNWRTLVKQRWSSEFEFIDPADDLVDWVDAKSYEIVQRDARAIERADAVLANMWKESIGTAIGVALARRHGTTVVVIDQNSINSKTLGYYADAVTDTISSAMKALRTLLRSREKLKKVIKKKTGEEVAFNRTNLAESVRNACRAAGRNDILGPAEIVPAVLERLATTKQPRPGVVTSTQIKNAVWDVLATLESDAFLQDQFAGVREAWECFERGRDYEAPATHESPTVHAKPQVARVFSGKSHSSIWGKAIKKLDEIPQPARKLFESILRVDGISEIRLTKKSAARGVSVEQVSLQITASKTPGIIEGKCFHSASKGEVQHFQVRVHIPERTESIRRQLVEHLGELQMLRTKAG